MRDTVSLETEAIETVSPDTAVPEAVANSEGVCIAPLNTGCFGIGCSGVGCSDTGSESEAVGTVVDFAVTVAMKLHPMESDSMKRLAY